MIYVANPFFIFILKKLPNTIITFVAICTFICYLVDNIISFNIIFNLQEVTNDLKKDNTEEISQKVRKIIIEKLMMHKEYKKYY